MRSPLKKKIIKDRHIIHGCENMLQLYEDLPIQIEEVSKFIDKYSHTSQLRFFISLVNEKHDSAVLQKSLYKYKYSSIIAVRNRSIYVVLKDLEHKETASAARNELKQRFLGQEYVIQIKILKKLFSHNKISARLAILLMAQNNIWEDWTLENIINELQSDKGVTTTIKSAGIEIIVRNAPKDLLRQYRDFVNNYLPYHFRCLNGFEEYIDKSRLFPMEYLDYYFSTHSKVEETVYSRIYIGTIKHEISNKKYLEIKSKKTWIPSLVSLLNTQLFLALAAKHNHEECIRWLYALDRNIQNNIKNHPSWKKVSLGANRTTEEIARVMECFYSCVLEYINARKMNDDISDFRLTISKPNDESLPF